MINLLVGQAILCEQEQNFLEKEKLNKMKPSRYSEIRVPRLQMQMKTPQQICTHLQTNTNSQKFNFG